MQSDFYVHFSQETAGLLAYFANQKNMDVVALIAELTVAGLKSAQEQHQLHTALDSANTKELWTTFPNKFDDVDWTWPGL